VNFEEQLRDALNHEGRALGAAGGDLHDIRHRGRRRKAWKAAGATFAAVLVVGVGALGVAVMGRGPSEPTPVAESTTDAPTTTTSQAASSTTRAVATSESVDTTTTLPSPDGPPVLVTVATTESEAPNGLVTIDATGKATPVFSGRFAALESDGRGGLAFQAQVATEDANRSRGSIYQVEAGTTEPVEIVTQDEGHIISMRTVAFIDGVAMLIYTDSFGFDAPETARQVLMAYDLDYSSMPRQVAVVGGWESGVVSVSYGGGILLLDSYAESERSWRFLDTDGNEVAARFNPLDRCEAGDMRCPATATMAPDGRLVYGQSRFFDSEGSELDLEAADFVIVNDQGLVLFTGGEEVVIEDFIERFEVRILDVATGDEKVLVSLFQERSEGEDGGAFVALDFDGRYLVVTDRKGVPTPPALVIDTERPEFRWGLDVGGVASFPLAPFDLAGVVESTIGS
jgi:hypothetical protein